MAEEPEPIYRRQAVQHVHARQHVRVERPYQKDAREKDIDDRLDEERGSERRIGRALDSPLDDEQPERVASAYRHDRVHAGAGNRGAEDATPANARLRVGSSEDVPPGP